MIMAKEEIENFDGISNEELEKRIRAFHTEKFPIHTFLHGRKFIYV